MQLIVNGAQTEVPAGLSLADLVAHLGLRVGSVVVEHNGTAMVRSELDGVMVHDDDVVELIRAVAGG